MDKDLMKIKLSSTLERLEFQMQQVEQQAKQQTDRWGVVVTPEEMMDSRGNFLMSPLLAARAQVLHALVLLGAS